MVRREWESLSESYRTRLQRAGITKQQYARGESLERARGHARTPEHPERAPRNPEKYHQYLLNANRRGGTVGGWSNLRIAVFNKLVKELIPHMERQYVPRKGHENFRWNYQSIYERLSKARDPETGELWDKAKMRRFLDMTTADFDSINFRDPEWSFLWYH